MRRIAAIFAASTLASLGALAVSPTAAFATAAAPLCDSGGSRYVCDAFTGGSTTWHISITQSGTTNSFTVTTPGPNISAGCSAHSIIHVSYLDSPVTSIPCNTGQWQ